MTAKRYAPASFENTDGSLCCWCRGELPGRMQGNPMAMFCSSTCAKEWKESWKWKKGQGEYAALRRAEGESRRMARFLLPARPCETCGAEGSHVHHRDGDPFNNDLANLARLCPPCHRKVHKAAIPRCAHCARPARKEGLCLHHHRRWVKHGDPLADLRGRTRKHYRLTAHEVGHLLAGRCMECGADSERKPYCTEHDVPWIGAAQKPKS